MKTNITTNYYESNAKEYLESTIHVDMSNQYAFFNKYFQGNCILDLGCGSGRDSLYFKNQGYCVYAMDPSSAFCEHVKGLGIEKVYQMSAQEMEFENLFDGIWACSSLLHVPYNELGLVFTKCKRALKENGIMYASFKMGDYEGERNGRYFTDLTLPRLESVIKDSGVCIIDSFESVDNRVDRDDKWLNVILK